MYTNMAVALLAVSVIFLSVIVNNNAGINRKKWIVSEHSTISASDKDFEVNADILYSIMHNLQIPKDYVGEYYKKHNQNFGFSLTYPNDNNRFYFGITSWNKFTTSDIQDRIKDSVKINGEWYDDKDIIYYKDQYAEAKKVVEDRYNKKDKERN